MQNIFGLLLRELLDVSLYSETTCHVRPFSVAEGVVSDDRFYCILFKWLTHSSPIVNLSITTASE